MVGIGLVDMMTERIVDEVESRAGITIRVRVRVRIRVMVRVRIR